MFQQHTGWLWGPQASVPAWPGPLSPGAPAMQGAFELLAQQNPRATSRMLEGMARRIAAASSARGRRWGPSSVVLRSAT